MDVRQQILDYVKTTGPVIPVQISKQTNSDILIASARLSELSSEGKLKISNLKVGGTPLYYLPGQEEELQKFSENLNLKEKEAFNSLKEKKVLRDSKIEPVYRVALREIKDFAIPLQVTYENKKEIFWKWFLLKNEEAEPVIKDLLVGEDEIEEESRGAVKEEKKKEPLMEKEIKKEQETFKPEKQESEKEEKAEEKLTEEKKERKIEKPKEEIKKEEVKPKEDPVSQTKKEPQEDEKIFEDLKKDIEEHAKKIKSVPEKTEKQEEKTKKAEEKKQPEKIEKQKPLLEEENVPGNFKKYDPDVKDTFLSEIKEYFSKNNIDINYFEIIRKNSEIDFLITVPSKIGSLEFYCKSKKKKTISDSDLSTAFVQGHFKRLPVLFLTKGKPTKKAKDMLNKEFKNIKLNNF